MFSTLYIVHIELVLSSFGCYLINVALNFFNSIDVLEMSIHCIDAFKSVIKTPTTFLLPNQLYNWICVSACMLQFDALLVCMENK